MSYELSHWTYVNNNNIYQMASQAYQANMNKKKEKQAEEVWKKIGQNEQLKGLTQLHKEIKDVEKFRN